VVLGWRNNYKGAIKRDIFIFDGGGSPDTTKKGGSNKKSGWGGEAKDEKELGDSRREYSIGHSRSIGDDDEGWRGKRGWRT